MPVRRLDVLHITLALCIVFTVSLCLQIEYFLLVFLHVCQPFILQSQICSSAHPVTFKIFSCTFLKFLCGVLHGLHFSAEFLHVSNHHKHILV